MPNLVDPAPSPHRAAAPVRPRWIRHFDRLSILVFITAWAVVAARLPELPDGGAAWRIALAFLLGYALADLASGVVHWLADRHFDPETPVLGPLLIAPFREHHAMPWVITRHGFLEVTGNNGLVTLPVAAALLAAPATDGASGWAFAQLTLLCLCLSVFATNLFHRWAHVARPPAPVRALQRARLVLPPEHHALHHRESHDRAFCVTSGWLNPLLDGIGLFRALDRAVEQAGALHLRRRAGRT